MAKKPEDAKSSATKKTENVKTASVNAAKSIPKNYKSTAEIKVSQSLVDQIMGQGKAVELIKKAAQQRRNVLLIGEPGTGGICLVVYVVYKKVLFNPIYKNPRKTFNFSAGFCLMVYKNYLFRAI